jgi:hypothetical protein
MWLKRGPWICHRLKREDLLAVRCWRRRDVVVFGYERRWLVLSVAERREWMAAVVRETVGLRRREESGEGRRWPCLLACGWRWAAAGRSSLLLADPAGVDAGVVAEGRKCWRRLFTVAVKGGVVVGSVWV